MSPAGQPLRVLMVEDSENDALLVFQELRRAGYEPATARVETAEAFRLELAGREWDLVIADYALPQFNAVKALEVLRASGLDLPFIIVSGAIGEDTAVAAMRAGAHDYVMKGNLARLGSAVERELREARSRRERRQLEAQLRVAERLQLVGQLVLGVAHEVRNPLNCIMAVAEALEEDLGQNPEYQQYIQHIRAQVDRLAALVRDLLDMGKPVDPARMHRDSIVAIVSSALALWHEAKPDDRHRITLDAPPLDHELDVMADGARLQQVFINLLDNAAQHSPPDSEIRLEIPEPRDEWVCIRVVDRGHGLPPDSRDRLFEPFFTTRKGGTGLGLCIVQRVVRDHGGEVTLTSNQPPPGCTAEVRLLRAREPAEGVAS